MPSLTREEKGFSSLDTYHTKELSSLYERLLVNYDMSINLSNPVDRSDIIDSPADHTLYFQKAMVEQGLKEVRLPYWENGGAVIIRPADSTSPFYKLSPRFYYARFRMVGGTAGTDISRRSLTKKLYAPLVLGIRYSWSNGSATGIRWLYQTPQYIQLDSFNFHEDYLFYYQQWAETINSQIASDTLARPAGDTEAKPPTNAKVTSFQILILQLYKENDASQLEVNGIPFVEFKQEIDTDTSKPKIKLRTDFRNDYNGYYNPLGFVQQETPLIAIPKTKVQSDAS